jgi:hypothetical protein
MSGDEMGYVFERAGPSVEASAMGGTLRDNGILRPGVSLPNPGWDLGFHHSTSRARIPIWARVRCLPPLSPISRMALHLGPNMEDLVGDPIGCEAMIP